MTYSYKKKGVLNAERLGKKVVEIDRFYPSSKTCHICGYKKDDLTLDIREWVCPVCHTIHDRDINAAVNIKAQGILKYSTAGTADNTSLRRSRKTC